MSEQSFYYCPICDKKVYNSAKHKCPEKVLRAIDSAHARGEDWEPPDNRTIGDRIREGNEMMRMAGDDDGD